jgi:hypothetical protein
VHPQKSVFGAENVEYLGHVISKYGQLPHEAKFTAIRHMPAPTNVSKVRSVHGLLNYCRCYCERLNAIAQPLAKLTKKNARWEWGLAQQATFDKLKEELCTEGIGTVLGQLDEAP